MPAGRLGRSWAQDPLLAAVRVLLSVFMAVTLVGGAVLALSVPTMPLWWPHVAPRLFERAGPLLSGDVAYMIGGIIALVAIIAVLAFYSLLLLRRLIDTVAGGDPFIPTNAERLARMGWIAVLIQALAFPADVLSNLVARAIRIPPADVGFSVGGILLALLLFVLARVFREGTRMREDLEGTV